MFPVASPTSNAYTADEQPDVLVGADLTRVFDGCFEGVAIADAESGRVLYVNHALSTWLGLHAESVDSKDRLNDLLQLNEARDLAEIRELLFSPQASQATHSAVLLPFSQAPIPVEIRIICITPAEKPLIVVLSSPTGQAKTGKADAAIARRDALTGVPDRAFLLARLAELLSPAETAVRSFAVLFIDLDNFKFVNDAYGHLVGDRVLQEVARRLSRCVRDQDHVVRFGGDEFVVLAERITATEDVARIIERIHERLEVPFTLPAGQITLSVSVGVALATSDHRSPEDILAEADRAMYASKRAPAVSR